jgi:hypothetical protein
LAGATEAVSVAAARSLAVFTSDNGDYVR